VGACALPTRCLSRAVRAPTALLRGRAQALQEACPHARPVGVCALPKSLPVEGCLYADMRCCGAARRRCRRPAPSRRGASPSATAARSSRPRSRCRLRSELDHSQPVCVDDAALAPAPSRGVGHMALCEGAQKWAGKRENWDAAQEVLAALARANGQAQLGKFSGPHPVPGGGRILQALRFGGAGK